jgi:hypothetical protein
LFLTKVFIKNKFPFQSFNTKEIKGIATLNKNNKNILRPWFITGLVDAEGSFNIFIVRSKSIRIKWTVQIRFIPPPSGDRIA